MFPTKIKIMGNQWIIEIKKEDQDFDLEEIGGYCDPYTKTIVVKDFRTFKQDPKGEAVMKTVLRHELVHALLAECGLWSNSLTTDDGWSMNEEMVDWIAINATRLYQLYEMGKCL